MNLSDAENCTNQPFPEFQIPWAVFTGVAGGFNAFLLAAVVNNWRVLRQNVTHYYIVSCLLSSIAFCTLSVYDTIVAMNDIDAIGAAVNGSHRYDTSNPDHNSVMNWFAFRRGLIPAFFIILQLNMVALIYGVSSNAFFVGRYVDEAMPKHTVLGMFNRRDNQRNRDTLKSHSLRWKRLTAIIVIALTWLIPLALAIPVPVGWSCVQYCKCLPVIRSDTDCQPNNESHICSKHWPPVSSSYILVVSSVWCLGMVTMFASLASAILKFYKTHSASRHPQSSFGNGTQSMPGNEGSDHGNQPEVASIKNISAKADSLASHNSRSVSLHSQELFRESNTSTIRRHKRPPLDPSVKMLICLSASLFATVFPLMFIMLLDATLQIVRGRMVFGIALTVSLFYVATLPFLLLRYMGGLRQAFNIIIMKFPCFRETVVKRSQSLRNQSGTFTRRSRRTRRNNAFEGDDSATSASADVVDVVDIKVRDL